MAAKALQNKMRADARPKDGQSGLYCTVDNWFATLDESLIHLGPHARRVHRLDDGREKFGLAEIIRNYTPEHRPELLTLLEQIDANNPSFDFRSRLAIGADRYADVHWVGGIDAAGTRINGVIVITERSTSETGE